MYDILYDNIKHVTILTKELSMEKKLVKSLVDANYQISSL